MGWMAGWMVGGRAGCTVAPWSTGAEQSNAGSTERFAGLAWGQGLGWFVGSLIDRQVHLLGILSAHLATVGTLAGWARPEAGDPGVAGPEYLSAATAPPPPPNPQTCCATMIIMPTLGEETSTLELAAPVAL